jgi:hypothetical protein
VSTEHRVNFQSPPRRALLWLVVIAAVFIVAQVASGAVRLPLGWDEAVYVSQVSSRVPAAFFSAPRARGITWLVAPVVALTSSTEVLRLWMMLLAAAGLVLAFWPWLRLAGRRVVLVGAAAFAGLWVVEFYAASVMPNLYVAYGALAAAGWFLRAADDRRRWPLAALAGSVAFTAVLRPHDAGYLMLALLAAVAAVRAWRRLALAVAVVAGLVVGIVPWLVEAYMNYGGPLARLRASSGVEGGLGWHLAAFMELRSVNGPLLCRPCTNGWPQAAVLSVWWLLLPVLAAGGLVFAARAGRLRVAGLSVWCAVVLTMPYFFLITYAAPRFLIPAYALLAVPVAECAIGLAGLVRGRWRPYVVGVAAVCVLAQLSGQYLVLESRVASQQRARAGDQWMVARLARQYGIRPPCAITGDQSPLLAFYAGCSSPAVGGNNASTTSAGLLKTTRAMPLALARHNPHPPTYAQHWPRHQLTAPSGEKWYVFIAPR